MAAATPTANYQQNGAQSLALAFPQVVGFAQNLDLIQIINELGGAVVVNVDYLGVVRKPGNTPAQNVGQTRIGVFQTQLSSSNTLAAIFADVFNPALSGNQDVLQVVNEGGAIVYWLDAVGVAHP